jgi:hypothetical protein
MDRFKPGCTWCKNTGWVVATHKTKIGLFGFRCSCSIGGRYSGKIPTWGSEYSQDFTPDAEGIVPILQREREMKQEPKKEVAKPKIDFRAKAAQANDWDDEEVPF